MNDIGSPERRDRTGRLPDEDLEPVEGAPRRTTERLTPTNEWREREPINPGWRGNRATGRNQRRAGALPASPQEFQLWLQNGGWRYVAGIAVLLLILLIVLLALSRSGQREAGLEFAEDPIVPTTEAQLGGAPAIDLPTATIAPADTTADPAPAPATGQFFIVTGTNGLGLFLRPDPSTNGAPLTTLPDGTRVEQIEADVAGGDYVWRKIRAPSGEEGWVAVDFLVPAP
jgi:hypothetical protein